MAKLCYESPDGHTERDVPHFEYNEHLEAFQIPVRETDAGETVFHEIPRERVYHVEWNEGDETPFQRVGEI